MEPAPPSVPPRPLLHGWRGLLILAVISLVGVVVAIGVWSTGEGDLKQIERDMANAGLPTTWKELGITRADAELVKTYERIAALAKVVKPAQTKNGNITPEPNVPLPAEMADWHARLPPAEVEELLRLIDGLPEERPYLTDDPLARQSAFWAWRDLVRLLGQRVALAADPEVADEGRRLLHLLAVAPRLTTATGALSDGWHLSMAAKSLAFRLKTVRGEMDLAAGLEALAGRLEALREQHAVGNLLTYMIDYRAMQRGTPSSRTPYPQRLVFRLTRESNLRAQLTWILQSRTSQPGFERHDLAQRVVNAANRPFHSLLGQRVEDPSNSEHSALRARLMALVVAAEIRGAPWPVDPFDRTRATLRRLERDDQLIAAYSVGRNGVDDLGGRGDEAFALYGPLTLPAKVAGAPANPVAASVSAPSPATP